MSIRLLAMTIDSSAAQVVTQPVPWLAIGAAAITASATLVGALISWIKDRNAGARRLQILDEAKKYIDFWSAMRLAHFDVTLASPEQTALEVAFNARLSLAARIVDSRGTHKRTTTGDILFDFGVQVLATGLTILFMVGMFLWVPKFLSGSITQLFRLFIGANLILIGVFLMTNTYKTFQRFVQHFKEREVLPVWPDRHTPPRADDTISSGLESNESIDII